MTPDFLNEFDFFTGVPDSLLKALCDFLLDKYGLDPAHHVIAANEGNAVALGAGYHLATGKVPVVYLQNSGLGNITNPAASLLNEKIYGIPCLFIVGWRGSPGARDEPQHIFQGEITLPMLETLGIANFVISPKTEDKAVAQALRDFREYFIQGKSCAFVVRKDAIKYSTNSSRQNDNSLTREEAIRQILAITGMDPVISTTGKTSRELYELREQNGQNHNKDFLTVGSMGHASSIALGIAQHKPKTTVWCIDGDGAILMHLGAMPIIGATKPKNFIHIAINNGAHESVGGQPTVAGNIDFPAMAKACGYNHAISVDNIMELTAILEKAKTSTGPFFIEVKCSLGSRPDLGRPASTPKENKTAFMAHLEQG